MNQAIDSGTTVSIFSLKQVEKNKFKINSSRINIKSAENSVTLVIGITDPLKIEINGQSWTLPLLIMNHDVHDVLLALDWFNQSGAGLFSS